MQACVSSRCRNEVRKSFASVARPTIEQALDVFEARHWIHAAVVRRLIDTLTPEKLARRRHAPQKAATAGPTQGDVKKAWGLRRSVTKACARRLASWACLEHLAGDLRNAEPATHAGVGVRAWSGAAGGDQPQLSAPWRAPVVAEDFMSRLWAMCNWRESNALPGLLTHAPRLLEHRYTRIVPGP